MGIPATLSSVPAQTPYIQYVATSGQTVFPYPFEITQDSDLVVVANGTTLATDSGYTVSGVGASTGGNITFTSGRTAGDIITLYRDIPISRVSQIAQNSGFSSTVFNAEYNNIYLLLQQLQQNIDQCLQIPNTNNPAPTTALLPANYANKYLAFDSNGNPEAAALTSSGSITRSILGGLLFPQTTVEADASVTPKDYSYPPGNIWRYGPKGDGSTDDTAAVADMLACGAQQMTLENGTFLCSGNQTLAASGTSLICKNATLKVKDETGITSGLGLINVTGNDNWLDLVIDGNGFGLSGVVLGTLVSGTNAGVNGNRNRLRLRVSNMEYSSSTQGYESAALVQGCDNTIWIEASNITAPNNPGQPIPRMVTCQGNSTGTTVELLRGRNVQSGLAVGSHTDITVGLTDLDTVQDIGFYLLSNCERIKVCGGRVRLCAQLVAFKGSDNEICNMLIVDSTSSPTIEDATNCSLRNCRFVDTDGTHAMSILATRSTNTLSNGVTLEDCVADSSVATSALLHFSTGTVNNVRVVGGYYKFTFTDDSSSSAVIVTHTAGNAVVYRDVVIDLEDAKTTPLTSANILNFDIPDLTGSSLYMDVAVINNTAGTVREGTSGGISQAHLFVRSRAPYTGNGLYLGGVASGVLQEVWGGQAPTSGTWGAGSVVHNTAGALGGPLGWVCVTAGSPGSWVAFGQAGYRSSSGSPSGTVTPAFIGEWVFDSTDAKWYRSTGVSNTAWQGMS